MLRTKATASAPMWTVPVLILLVSHNFDPAVAFTFTFDPPTRKTGLVRCSSFVRRIRTTSLGSAPSLGGGRGEWDNDDFLSSLSSTPQGGSNENEESSPPSGKGKGDDQVGSGSERFRRMKEIAESGVPPPRPPPKLSAPPPPPPPPPQAEQAEAGAAASTAVPPPPPPPGYGPPGYYPPPPGYGYPPPPPPSGAEGQPATAGVAEGQAAAATPPPTGYYPPPPPPGYDPSNPPPPGYMPGYYPPQGYYPPPPGYDYYAQQQTQQPHDPENPPPPQPQYYPPPPPTQAQSQAPAKTTRDDTGRRRRPEDKIANTSDLYLEQLKIDSTSRTRARLRGDEETANRAWVDPQIRAVKEQLDPILSSETRKSSEKGVDSGGLYATSRDEMLIFRDGDAKVDKSDTGVSYRQRMADKMKGKKKSAGKTAVESPKAAIPAPEQPATVDIVDESPKAAVESIAEADIIKPESTVPSPPSLPEPTELEDQPATVVGGEQQRQAPLPPPMSSDQETSVPLTPAPVTAAEEDARRQIRALMGLLLKHRGGPGFGAGRLKNPAEIRRFDETLCEVMDLLGEEAGVDVEVAPAAVPSPPAASATGGASGGGPALSGALACVKGAVQMYEGAAAGRERDDLLGPLRDALRHAVDVCTAAIDAGDAGGSDKGEFDFPKAGNYNVDMSVPAAAAAASPSAEAVKTEDGASSRGTTPPTATLETSAGKDVRASVVGGDGSDNEEVLRKAYRELKEARGDGKYGLDPSITGLEAGELADSLLDMRRVLMSELDIGGVVSGGGDSSPSAEVVAAGETKSKSNYQDMLAKAKAAKAAKKAGAGGT